MSARSEIVKLGEENPTGLDVVRLERELAALWREESDGTPEDGTVVRACHSTVVLDVEHAPPQELLDDLVRLHPSRTILVRPRAEFERERVDAWASAVCARRPDGGSMVCGELIHFEAGPGTDAVVAGAVRSLSIAGVPVVLLSQHRSPLEIGWANKLDRVADIVLGNSERLSVADGRALWSRGIESDEKPWVRDLLWTHLRDWRRAIAGWFDRPQTAGDWTRIRSVVVEVADSPGGTLKAWLLTGWLGARLGWKPSDAKDPDSGFAFHGPGGEVTVKFDRAAGSEDPAVALSVSMQFEGKTPVCWRRLSRERALVVEEGKGGPRLARLNQAKTGAAAAIVSEIHQHEPDPLAKEAMAFAVNLTGKAAS